jgi:hypothetical protein
MDQIYLSSSGSGALLICCILGKLSYLLPLFPHLTIGIIKIAIFTLDYSQGSKKTIQGKLSKENNFLTLTPLKVHS